MYLYAILSCRVILHLRAVLARSDSDMWNDPTSMPTVIRFNPAWRLRSLNNMASRDSQMDSTTAWFGGALEEHVSLSTTVLIIGPE